MSRLWFGFFLSAGQNSSLFIKLLVLFLNKPMKRNIIINLVIVASLWYFTGAVMTHHYVLGLRVSLHVYPLTLHVNQPQLK